MQEQEALAQGTPLYVEEDESEFGDEGGVSEVVGEMHSLPNEFVFGCKFDEGIFEGGRERARLTHQQKWGICQQFAKDHLVHRPEVDLSPEVLWKLQQEDGTLATVREAANGSASTAGPGLFKKDSLIYWHWMPQDLLGTDMQVDQLLLPKRCRHAGGAPLGS